jgi:hypothetical protein
MGKHCRVRFHKRKTDCPNIFRGCFEYHSGGNNFLLVGRLKFPYSCLNQLGNWQFGTRLIRRLVTSSTGKLAGG